MACTRERQVYQLWIDIQDQIGDATQWPHTIRRLFWTRNINHWERILLCTFCWVNGLNPVVFEEWWRLIGLCRDRAAENHMAALFRLFEGGRNYTLYAFNMAMNRYEYLDGRPRRYVHRSMRQ